MLLESAYGSCAAPGAANYNTNWTSPSKTNQFFNILIDMLPPGVLNHCKLQYRLDRTLKSPTVFQHFNRTFADIIEFYNTKSTLASLMSPWQPLGPEVRLRLQPTPPDVAPELTQEA